MDSNERLTAIRELVTLFVGGGGSGSVQTEITCRDCSGRGFQVEKGWGWVRSPGRMAVKQIPCWACGGTGRRGGPGGPGYGADELVNDYACQLAEHVRRLDESLSDSAPLPTDWERSESPGSVSAPDWMDGWYGSDNGVR